MPRARGSTRDEDGTGQRVDVVDIMGLVDENTENPVIFETETHAPRAGLHTNADLAQIAMPRARGSTRDEDGTGQRVDVVDIMGLVDENTENPVIFETETHAPRAALHTNADLAQIAMPRARGSTRDENGTGQRVDVVDIMGLVDENTENPVIFETETHAPRAGLHTA